MKSYIPTIDISSLLDGKFVSKEAKKTILSIKKACVEVGFFQVIGHGLKNEEIKNICAVGNKFFNMEDKCKRKLSPKKWNKKNKNIYRGYFPNDVNGKEGLDLGDLKVSSKYSNNIKNQYIEYLNLQKCFNLKSVKKLNSYFDNIFYLSEILFKSIIVYYKKDPKISNQAFSRLKTLSTLRFNNYPNQKNKFLHPYNYHLEITKLKLVDIHTLVHESDEYYQHDGS